VLGLALVLAAGTALAQGEPEPPAQPLPVPQPHGARPHAKHPEPKPTPGMMMHLGHGEEPGLYGSYPMTRDASGTAWQPDASRHHGLHAMRGDWTLMAHGMADVVRDRQGGPRGGNATYSPNMLMGSARHTIGDQTIGFRAMLSAEPSTIGRSGYPLLLQSGETADGRTPLVDRQHPHDAVMELAGMWNKTIDDQSVFLYGGWPGEPALGPPAFMHRFSAMAIPEAPITHHWLDSTHIAWGVVTVGAVADQVKLEASWFRGREPDQHRTDFEHGPLDSRAYRFSLNPSPAWSLQVSHGHLVSPEQLAPDVNVDRTTASVMYAASGPVGEWGATLAWGRNRERPGHTLDGLLLEAATQVVGRQVVFARAEQVQKDELFRTGPLAGEVLKVGQLCAGYRVDVWRGAHAEAGIGALATVTFLPPGARDDYGGRPRSGLAWVHLALR
jgi:hypothetical protein